MNAFWSTVWKLNPALNNKPGRLVNDQYCVRSIRRPIGKLVCFLAKPLQNPQMFPTTMLEGR